MKIQLKRSEVTNSGSAKEPTAAQMEYGELAVNYSDEDPAIFLKNKSNEIIRIAGAGANGNIEIPESGSGPHQPGTSDDRYIEVTGDNMTGDLTLGTDKITLDATAGNATFAGYLTAANGLGAGRADGTVVILNNADDQKINVVNSNNEITFHVDNTGTTFIGETVNPRDGNIILNADGAASFGSTVTVGSSSAAIVQGLSGIINYPANSYSAAIVGTNATAGGRVWLGQNSAAAATSEIFEDGKATFSGGVINDASGTGYFQTAGVGGNYGYVYAKEATSESFVALNYRAGGNQVAFVAEDSGGNTLAAIDWLGGATFASNVTLGDAQNTTSGAGGTGLYTGDAYYAGGSIVVYKNTDAALQNGVNNNAFEAYARAAGTADTMTLRSSIHADGTASFAGTISANVPVSNYGFALGANTSPAGGLYLSDSGSGSLYLAPSYGGAASVSILGQDGSAVFTGTVSATVVPPGSDARFKENIEPAKPQLADVVALGGLLKNYDWNEDAPVNDEIRAVRQLGLIAQEVETVCPAVVKDIHRTKTVEVTPAVTGPKGAVIKEAVTKEEDDSHKTISTDALIMKLIGAVAELSAEVTALKAVKTTKK